MSDTKEPALAALIGEWNVEVVRPGTSPDPIPARHRFEWILGDEFVLHHSTVDHPDFPDTMAVLSAGTSRYFDSRGVFRTYQLSIGDGVWRFWREDPDFWQRFTGTFSEDGTTITGAWEMSHDNGATWTHDMTMTFTKAG